MNLTKCEIVTTNIQNLPDSPNLSPQDLKKEFDKSGEEMKQYINNTLTTEIETGIEEEIKKYEKQIKKTYKHDITLTTQIEKNTDYTIPNTYTVNTSNLDVYYEGCLLNINDHYTERGTGESNKIRFDWNVPSGSKLSFIIRK